MLENLFNYATSFAASPMDMRQKPGIIRNTQDYAWFTTVLFKTWSDNVKDIVVFLFWKVVKKPSFLKIMI